MVDHMQEPLPVVLRWMATTGRPVQPVTLALAVAPDVWELLTLASSTHGTGMIRHFARRALRWAGSDVARAVSPEDLSVLIAAKPRIAMRSARRMHELKGGTRVRPMWEANVGPPPVTLARDTKAGIFVLAGGDACTDLTGEERRAVEALLGVGSWHERRTGMTLPTTWSILSSLPSGAELTTDELQQLRRGPGLDWFYEIADERIQSEMAGARCPELAQELPHRWSELTQLQREVALAAPWWRGAFDRGSLVLRHFGERRRFSVAAERVIVTDR